MPRSAKRDVIKMIADRTVTPIVPRTLTPTSSYGRRVNPAGETVPYRYVLGDDGKLVVMGIFVPLPYTIEQIREAAQEVSSSDAETIARTMRLSGRRFVHALRVTKTRDAP